MQQMQPTNKASGALRTVSTVTAAAGVHECCYFAAILVCYDVKCVLHMLASALRAGSWHAECGAAAQQRAGRAVSCLRLSLH